MEIGKRLRGRPPGSSFRNVEDAHHLARIADRRMIVQDRDLTAAMRAVGIADETTQRRVRRKWNAAAEMHMHDARERRRIRDRAAADEMRRGLAMIGAELRAQWQGIDPGIYGQCRDTRTTVGSALYETARTLALWGKAHPEIVASLRPFSATVAAFRHPLVSPVEYTLLPQRSPLADRAL